ncbi:calpain-8-like isoform X2 [Antennarius striatus]|uniref:calpain-8-like isoform X2 n=1 Tax=Antennarius striatus TaxID=241820 RepID=UPI0035B0013D
MQTSAGLSNECETVSLCAIQRSHNSLSQAVERLKSCDDAFVWCVSEHCGNSFQARRLRESKQPGEVLQPRLPTAETVLHRKWKKIVPNPSFVIDGVSRFDFAQGILGNCWFLASIGALTFQIDILRQVVPPKQTFDEHYCGLFHFRFWRFGRWVDVVIDDKLPTINGNLIFAHAKNQNEFWPPLLEKAYAKVCGSYSDMKAGTPAEAMVDFTGGVHMSIQLSDPPPDLWELMFRAGKSRSLMGCGTPGTNQPSNTVLPNGLIQDHAYTVTGVKEMISQGALVKLVRLWNPWGKQEWKGDWSDRSPLWNAVSAQDREMCLCVADDGEFWMTLEEFCKCFSELDICCTSPDFLDGDSSCQWKTSSYQGRWVAGITAGGCMNNRDTFWTNPQYQVKIEGEHSGKPSEKNVLLSLMQKPDKRHRGLFQNRHIGFSVYEVTEEDRNHKGKFPASFFRSHAPVSQTKTFTNAREVMEFLSLKPGEYLIVPSTFNPNETASFLLTIISKTETHGYENTGDNKHEPIEKATNEKDDENKTRFFHQHSDKFGEVDAEQLQGLLNDKILKGDLKSGGFSIDACRSMVALMDTSITGKLNGEEFVYLWNKIISYKDIFYHADVSRTGRLSLNQLRSAFTSSGMTISDEMLNLMALRYGTSSGNMTLESFIMLILRFDCMHKIFKHLSDRKVMTLYEAEWLYISMYT